MTKHRTRDLLLGGMHKPGTFFEHHIQNRAPHKNHRVVAAVVVLLTPINNDKTINAIVLILLHQLAIFLSIHVTKPEDDWQGFIHIVKKHINAVAGAPQQPRKLVQSLPQSDFFP